MRSEHEVRPLSRDEVDTAVTWAAAEGWNPGRHDADAFWAQDPHGFWGVDDVDGHLAGCVSAISYDGAYGFWGLFIVRPDQRGRGIGSALARTTIRGLRDRLDEGAAIGLDGVYAQQDYYASLGFAYSHRNLRMAGTARAGLAIEHELVAQADLDPSVLQAFDTEHLGAARPRFLERWSRPVDGSALAAVEDGAVVGTGVVRRCLEGFKVGPLFARDADVAASLLARLSAYAEGGALFLDVPEVNEAAMALADEHGMTEVFGCARMYLGDPPATPWSRVFGVTTFELG
jgi:GNAT superfamily N-acetyltransferase